MDFPLPCYLSKVVGENKYLGMLESDHLGMLAVSPPRLFHLTFVLCRGQRKFNLMCMLVLVLIWMFEVYVPSLLRLTFRDRDLAPRF